MNSDTDENEMHETLKKTSNNYKLLDEAMKKVFNRELNSAEEVYRWLYSKGYHSSITEKMANLHTAEQLDAEHTGGNREL